MERSPSLSFTSLLATLRRLFTIPTLNFDPYADVQVKGHPLLGNKRRLIYRKKDGSSTASEETRDCILRERFELRARFSQKAVWKA